MRQVARRVVALLGMAVTAFALAQPAHASQPVPGGRYVDSVHPKPGVTIDVDVKLANDGREFAEVSAVWMDLICGNTSHGDHLELSSDAYSSRAVQIRRSGRFSARSYFGAYLTSVRGRFVDRGRRMVGRAYFRDSGRCRTVEARFSARLVGRPNAPRRAAPSKCDWVGVGYLERLDINDGYAVYDLGAGCTAAREFARDWNADPICRHLIVGDTCAIPRATCEAIRGGRFHPLAGARCEHTGRPGSAVELVHEQPCPPPSHPKGVTVYARGLNVSCDVVTSFPLRKLLGDDRELTGPCGTALSDIGERTRCTPVGGFTCVVRPIYYDPDGSLVAARCTRDGDPFEVLTIDVDY